MVKFDKTSWLTEVPNLLNNLKKKYNFYYDWNIHPIKRDILDIVRDGEKKYKHHIFLYRYQTKPVFFLVVYRKADSIIYYTQEYASDVSWKRINYFQKKFKNAYELAGREDNK